MLAQAAQVNWGSAPAALFHLESETRSEARQAMREIGLVLAVCGFVVVFVMLPVALLMGGLP